MMKRADRFTKLAVMMSTLAQGGCANPSNFWLNVLPSPSPHESSVVSEDLDAAPAYRGDVAIRLAFDITRIDIACAPGCNARKIWNHVDEIRIDTDTLARFVRNGIRVGVATPDSWPAIETIWDATDASVRHHRLFAQQNTPVLVTMGGVTPGATYFHYNAHRQLVGRTMEGGEKTITIDYAFHPDMGGATEIQLLFEIWRDKGTMRFEQRDGAIQQVPDVDRYVYDELRLGVTLRPGESLLIGPGEFADNEYLVGGRFFRGGENGTPRETLLNITPVAVGIPWDQDKSENSFFTASP